MKAVRLAMIVVGAVFLAPIAIGSIDVLGVAMLQHSIIWDWSVDRLMAAWTAGGIGVVLETIAWIALA